MKDKTHDMKKGAQFTHTKGIDQKTFNKESLHNKGIEVCFAQMSAKKGIKTFGMRAVAAMFKEYQQLDDMTVFGARDSTMMSRYERSRALRAINLINDKRCGRIKGRTCADDRPQRDYVSQE